MDWINNPIEGNAEEIAMLKKIDKLTLYDHNYTSRINLQKLTFNCLFNCKMINRKYNIIGQIQGDLLAKNIQISCSLVDLTHIICGKCHHQKMQLMKFAYKYNEKSSGQSIGKSSLNEEFHNYQIKVNPLNGQFYVCFHFFFSNQFLKDHDKFKMKLTDECERIGQQAQKIFNTVIQIIFNEQANDPYLKADERIGLNYSKPVKMEKLLKKIKKLSIISNKYKIKQEIGGINRLRSHFQKIYLKTSQKPVHSNLVLENALVYIPQFCKKHLDALSVDAPPTKKKNQYISPFQNLQQSNQIQFAKHLKDSFQKNEGQTVVQINNHGIPPNHPPQNLIGKKVINGLKVSITSTEGKSRKQQYDSLKKLPCKHPNMVQYYYLPGYQTLRVIEDVDADGMPLIQYLQRSKKSLTLLTRLDLMSQICHIFKSFHQNHIGYFIDIKNVYVLKNNVIKITSIDESFSVCSWQETSSSTKDGFAPFVESKIYYPLHCRQFDIVSGKQPDQGLIENIQNEEEFRKYLMKKLANERCDVYCLGMILYKILMDKFPFCQHDLKKVKDQPQFFEEYLKKIWVVDMEYFVRQGGMVTKLLAHLLLKCFYLQVKKRPFVEWITVIICEVKSSLQGIY